MSLRLILATPFITSFAALVLLALSGRTPPSLANDGSDQGAEEGWGVIAHSQLATENQGVEHA